MGGYKNQDNDETLVQTGTTDEENQQAEQMLPFTRQSPDPAFKKGDEDPVLTSAQGYKNQDNDETLVQTGTTDEENQQAEQMLPFTRQSPDPAFKKGDEDPVL